MRTRSEVVRTYYAVEKQLTAQPTKCWVVRISFGTDGKRIFTPLLGPFLGAIGEDAAARVADELSAHHTDEWDQLGAGR